jgi:hypothetical protein
MPSTYPRDIPALRLLGGPGEDDEQKPDDGHGRAVIDPFRVPDQNTIGGIAVKAEALSHEAESGDQGDNSDDS